MMELLGCLCDELESTLGGAVCWCGLWQGDPVPWDYCDGCDGGLCGMAYARLITAYPYDSFPTIALDQTCRKPLAYQIEVGVMRCFPIMDDDGSLPMPGVVSDAVLSAYDDMEAMRRALLCCGQTGVEVWLGEYLPANEGGCAGGAFTAFINLEP
jgi:hypothetical protein